MALALLTFAALRTLPDAVAAQSAAPASAGRLLHLSGASFTDADLIPVDHVSVWAWRDGAWQAIPHQVDQWVEIRGGTPSPGTEEDLDPDDELVLAEDDLGAWWPGTLRPAGIAEDVWPVEIRAHAGGSDWRPGPVIGSAYLFIAPAPPEALAVPPRIRWDAESGHVVSEAWSVGLRGRRGGDAFLDHLSLRGSERDLVRSWSSLYYPSDGTPPPPSPRSGVVATPVISGPLRAVFGYGRYPSLRSQWVEVGPRYARLPVVTRISEERRALGLQTRLVLEAEAGARVRDERYGEIRPDMPEMGRGAPWPAWWSLETEHGRLVGLPAPEGECANADYTVAASRTHAGDLRLALTVTGPAVAHSAYQHVPYEVYALSPAASAGHAEQLDAVAASLLVRVLGTRPDPSVPPTPTATPAPDPLTPVRISGRVVDGRRYGQPPVPGLRVAAGDCSQRCSPPAWTDEEGRFDIRCARVFPLGYVAVRVWRPGKVGLCVPADGFSGRWREHEIEIELTDGAVYLPRLAR